MRVTGNRGTRGTELLRSVLSSLKYHEPVISRAGTDPPGWKPGVQHQGVSGVIPSRGARGESVSYFSSSLEKLVPSVNPWHSLACRCITPICLHLHMAVFPLCMFVFNFPFIRTPVTGLGTIQIQYGLILT